MRTVDLIQRKRDGGELDTAEISYLVEGYTRGEIPDYQMSAFLMAVFFAGMTDREVSTLTDCMIRSGETVDLSSVKGVKVDKHSTGGVGDKTSLIVAPLAAVAGVIVPMISGRALGHTGGTLDKLESIPGFRTDLTVEQFRDQLNQVGLAFIGQSDQLAPADGKLYALRDVTATVESIPLIASSIMSKKMAEGLDSLVLDVKVGSGAFMQHEDDARRLAETMVAIGAEHGVRTTALLTRMDTPLGRAVGNAVEVEESLATLGGEGPADLVAVTLALAKEMAALAGLEADLPALLRNGAARSRFDEMVRAQGGDPAAALPQAPLRRELPAPASGFVRRLDARAVGVAAWRLGAGRAKKEDPVSASAGVVCLAKPGEPVEEGQPVLEVRAEDEARFARALEALEGALEVGPEPPELPEVVIEAIRS